MKWMRNHPGRRITVDQLGSLFNKSVIVANAASGFNPENSPEHEYIDDPHDIHGSINETEESNVASISSSSVLLDDTTDSTPVQFDVCQKYYNNTDTSLLSLADNTMTRSEVLQTNKCTNESESANENITSLSSKKDPNQSSSSTIKVSKLKVPQEKMKSQMS